MALISPPSSSTRKLIPTGERVGGLCGRVRVWFVLECGMMGGLGWLC